MQVTTSTRRGWATGGHANSSKFVLRRSTISSWRPLQCGCLQTERQTRQLLGGTLATRKPGRPKGLRSWRSPRRCSLPRSFVKWSPSFTLTRADQPKAPGLTSLGHGEAVKERIRFNSSCELLRVVAMRLTSWEDRDRSICLSGPYATNELFSHTPPSPSLGVRNAR